MRITKILPVALLVLIIISLGGILMLRRNLRQMDFRPLEDLVKARLGEAIVVPIFRPEKGQSDAKLFETYLRAQKIAIVAAHSRMPALPSSSDELLDLDSPTRRDAWGQPFCLARSGSRVAVISAGPHWETFAGCRQMDIDLDEAFRLPSNRFYSYPSGRLVLIVDLRH